jgi:hypothetical protein
VAVAAVLLALGAMTLIAAAPADDHAPAAMTVHIRDYCDTASFGALCTRTAADQTAKGFITRGGFNAELAAEHSVGAWRFILDRSSAPEGATLTLQNLGGETHTFTRVQQFGGGFVAPLNAGAGTPDPAPECASVVNGALVPQPPSANNVFLPAGATMNGPAVRQGEVAHFQCCIHPWMRTTVNARGEQGEHDNQ